MDVRNRPRWTVLNALLLVFLIAVFSEARLPIPSLLDAWLDGLLVVLFYGGIACWVWWNSFELEGTNNTKVGMPKEHADHANNER